MNAGLKVKFFREKKFPGHGGQALAAKAAKVTQPVWSRYENAERLSRPTLLKIAKILDVTIDDLVREDSPPPPPIEADGTGHLSFKERGAMDIKKALQTIQQNETMPFVMCIGHYEFRVVYKIVQLGETSAMLVTSIPIAREVADEVLKGKTDPNRVDEETGRPERINHIIGYTEITYMDFIG